MSMNGADIQVERGGYTRIHNEIIEQLSRHDFSGQEYACLFYLLRMTYGFNRKEYQLSNKDFQKATGVDSANVSRLMRRLVDGNVVTRSDNGPRTKPTWAFNKYHEQWSIPLRGKQNAESYCQSDSTPIVDSTQDLLSEQQYPYCQPDNTPIVSATIDDCQSDNRYLMSKDNLKDSSKDNIKTGEYLPGLPMPEKPAAKRLADEYTSQAKTIGITPDKFVGLVNVVLDLTGLRPLVDAAGDDKALNDAKQAAITLARLGYCDVEAIKELGGEWKKANAYRNAPPSVWDLPKFGSTKVQASIDAAKTKKKVKRYTVDPVTGERCEIEVTL